MVGSSNKHALTLFADRQTTEESIRIYPRMMPDFIVVKCGCYLNKENQCCYNFFVTIFLEVCIAYTFPGNFYSDHFFFC